MKLQDYKAQYEALKTKKNLKGEEALEAVKENGYALAYVDARFFENVADDIIELNGKKYKLID